MARFISSALEIGVKKFTVKVPDKKQNSEQDIVPDERQKPEQGIENSGDKEIDSNDDSGNQ